MSKARRALTGNEAGFVTAANFCQILAGELESKEFFSVVAIGCSVETKASEDPGPVISILPISNLRSSIIAGGR